MRILLDLQACQAANGRQGIGRSSLEFARALARSMVGRHELLVALNAAFPAEADRIKAELGDVIPKDAFVAWQTPVPCDGRTGGNREIIASQIRQQFIDSLGVDVVHTPSVFEGFGDNAITAIAPASDRSHIESATLHDLIPLVHRQIYLADPAMAAWYERKLEDLKRADLLLSVSSYSRGEGLALLGRDPDSIVNISSGVDAAFKPRASIGDVKQRHGIRSGMVMYAGGIDVRKNVERLIQAYAGLPAELRKGRQLAIVCRISDQYRMAFAELAAQAGLRPDELVMTGYVSDEDLVALYSGCDLFVFPSWHEGFGLPALEAMACGAPVIASAVSSLPEVVGFPDALFDPMDVASIRSVMARALSDRAWATMLAEHGRQRAAQFTWERTARTALETFERAMAERQANPVQVSRARLAYVSPMPPERSGISDYSVELLPALSCHYDITVVTPEWRNVRAGPGIEVRGVEWFAEHAPGFDRIVYQFGNSTFHSHMFDLIARYPGVAVLHDFFLSGIVAHLAHGEGAVPSLWDEYLYRSHGYDALRYKAAQPDSSASIWKYPANFPVVERSIQVIVHSRYSVDLAAQWYGPHVAGNWHVVPQLRAPIPETGAAARRAARQRLSIAEDTWLVCSFGMVGPSKLSARLLDAWELGGFSANMRGQLVFVGANQPSPYGEGLTERLIAAPNARITGFVDDRTYMDYLLAADVAVQLRTLSRGETSRAALDCMAAGLPLIVNRNGSMAEIPFDCAEQIDDEFNDRALVSALRALADPARRANMSARQRAHVEGNLSPALVAELYRDAIESAYTDPAARSLRALGAQLSNDVRDDRDLMDSACEALAFNNPGVAPCQLLVDVSELVNRDAKSGIQRVVRGVLGVLLEDDARAVPHGYRVEPVYTPGDGRYYYARGFTGRWLQVNTGCADEPINVRRGDIFLGLDLAPVDAVRSERALTDMRLAGAKIFFVLYDVLPLQRPDCFPPEADGIFRPWTEMVARIADGVACISRQVCRDFADAADVLGVKRPTPLALWHFPLGMSLPTAAHSEQPLRQDVAELVSAREPLVMMVGTLEPRKGHSQALSAMEQLWLQGYNATLVIVGKQGWMVEALIERIHAHPEHGKRLHWLAGASDGELDALYAKSAAVLCASEAEGYGLPLIEAASRGVAVIARDIPVFREVAGHCAAFFSGTNPEGLAAEIARVLDADSREIDIAPGHHTWHESVARLFAIMSGQLPPEMTWRPGRRLVVWGHQACLRGDHLVRRQGRLIHERGGELDAGLYLALEAGAYRLTTIDPLSSPGKHPLPELATLEGRPLTLEEGGDKAHGATGEFRLEAPTSGLRLHFPHGPTAAIGTLTIERLN
jgi:glycosyltransferase involved in cell wall biosynthesis